MVLCFALAARISLMQLVTVILLIGLATLACDRPPSKIPATSEHPSLSKESNRTDSGLSQGSKITPLDDTPTQVTRRAIPTTVVGPEVTAAVNKFRITPTMTTRSLITPTPSARPTVAPTPTTRPLITPTPSAQPTAAPTPTTLPPSTVTPTTHPTVAPTPTTQPPATERVTSGTNSQENSAVAVDYALGQCLVDGLSSSAESRHMVKWSIDGSEILFDFSSLSPITWYEDGVLVYSVDAEGTRLRRVAEASIASQVRNYPIVGSMTHFDISPDGSRVVYSTCRHGPLVEDPTSEDYWDAFGHSYEIETASIDGTDIRRLTDNDRMDNFPAWSPDGTRIAFIADGYPESKRPESSPRLLSLFTMAPDGSGVKEITPGIDNVVMRPPVWSPTGSSVAFVMKDRKRFVEVIYTVGTEEGSEPTNISDTLSAPSWSPDGDRLAFVAVDDGDGISLFTAASDGTDRTMVTQIFDDMTGFNSGIGGYATYTVSWSPARDRILYPCGTPWQDWTTCVVSTNGHPVGRGHEFESYNHDYILASWSPDGARIAVRTVMIGRAAQGRILLYTMAPDGSGVEHLIRAEEIVEGREHLGLLNALP